MSALNNLIGTLNDSSLRVEAFSSFVTPANYPNFEEFFRKVGKLSVAYRELEKGRRVFAYHRLVKAIPGLVELDTIGESALAETLLKDLIEVLTQGLAKPGDSTRHLDLPSVRKLRRIRQWITPFLPRKGVEKVWIWSVSFDKPWIQGMLRLLLNLDLYLLHHYIQIFPHSWGFIQKTLRFFVFHHKGAQDLKTSLTSQFETLKACLLPDWEDIDFDALKLKFETPIHRDLEKIISRFVFSADISWRTSVATFRRQINCEKEKLKEYPCHWIHSNSGITLKTLREWGKTCWNPSEENRRTNPEETKRFREAQFNILKPPEKKKDIPNPFADPKGCREFKRKEHRNYLREKDLKRVKNEGRFG